MKNKKRSGSLFGLLTRNYLAFTLALLAIAYGVYQLWSFRVETYFSSADVEGMVASSAFREGRYSALSARKYLGAGTAFSVLDEDGTLIYRSDESFDADLTPGELSCVPKYNGDTYIDYMEYTSDNGEVRYQITRTSLADGGSKSEVMVLDERLQVLSGGFEPGRTGYTQAEFDYLTGRGQEEYTLYRLDFSDANGTPRVLLLRFTALTQAAYDRLIGSANRLWLLALPLYTAASVGFILWLNKRIRRPLDRLDRAIVGLGEGLPARASDCGGPREIELLGENFDSMARKLAESEQERKRLDESRQKLIADISHDLKTPITVISGYTNAIRDGKVPPDELPRYLEAIDAKATALTALINTFYEYSKTDHPDFRLEQVETDLCEFLREYLADKYDEIDLAGFALEVSIPEKPVRCRLDGFQFRRALDNILSNSLRHNRLGTIIRVELRPGDGCASVFLADNGEGISPALRAHIFEPFRTGDESRSGGGSGLGLTITKKIVEAHGGSIRLLPAARAGQGTEFELTLPTI